MTFRPVLKNYIWGGRSLERFGRDLPSGIIAESWEIAGHRDGTTKVENGHYAGRPLTDVQAELGLDLIGRNNAWAQERGKFPLLIKLLDAKRPLSVQVHPNDEYALVHEGNELGKSEMWVVLSAEPDAQLILGVKAGTTREEFGKAIERGHLEPYLHYLPVKTGDHVCVPAGSLHAIMDGLLIAEIQQNSNTTYRVYDWNRMGADGRPRPLHVEKALDVINFNQVEPQVQDPLLRENADGIRRYQLCQNQYFITERLEFDRGAVYEGYNNGESLEIWGFIDGSGIVAGLGMEAIRFALLPAALGRFSVAATSRASVLRSYVSTKPG
jgi:mannose-6-phosphate isomerase